MGEKIIILDYLVYNISVGQVILYKWASVAVEDILIDPF